MSFVIETHDLTHRFGGFKAVDGVDLRVETGSIYGFLGPNGSGKTTTIRILLGLLRPQAGRVAIFGLAMPRDRRAIARSVGSMVETPSLYGHLSGFDNVDLTRRALGLRPAETWRVLDLVDLRDVAKQRAGDYSLGMRQRLGICRALLGEPRLLILDEPTNGLDPAGVTDMRRLIRDLPNRQGVSVFVSSHLLAEVEQVATHVGLMFQGALVAQSSLADMLASLPRRIEMGVARAEQAVLRLKAARVDAVAHGADRLHIAIGNRGQENRAHEEPAALNAMLVREGFDVSSIRIRQPSLEEVFLSRTTPSPTLGTLP
jgi:ABC-2 type transport system ATP-binding protein